MALVELGCLTASSDGGRAAGAALGALSRRRLSLPSSGVHAYAAAAVATRTTLDCARERDHRHRTVIRISATTTAPMTMIVASLDAPAASRRLDEAPERPSACESGCGGGGGGDGGEDGGGRGGHTVETLVEMSLAARPSVAATAAATTLPTGLADGVRPAVSGRTTDTVAESSRVRCAVTRAVEPTPLATSVERGARALMTSASVARKTVRETTISRLVACKLRGESTRARRCVPKDATHEEMVRFGQAASSVVPSSCARCDSVLYWPSAASRVKELRSTV